MTTYVKILEISHKFVRGDYAQNDRIRKRRAVLQKKLNGIQGGCIGFTSKAESVYETPQSTAQVVLALKGHEKEYAFVDNPFAEIVKHRPNTQGKQRQRQG